MCKESMQGSECPGCGNTITFTEQHIEKCPNYPAALAHSVRMNRKLSDKEHGKDTLIKSSR